MPGGSEAQGPLALLLFEWRTAAKKRTGSKPQEGVKPKEASPFANPMAVKEVFEPLYEALAKVRCSLIAFMHVLNLMHRPRRLQSQKERRTSHLGFVNGSKRLRAGLAESQSCKRMHQGSVLCHLRRADLTDPSDLDLQAEQLAGIYQSRPRTLATSTLTRLGWTVQRMGEPPPATEPALRLSVAEINALVASFFDETGE